MPEGMRRRAYKRIAYKWSYVQYRLKLVEKIMQK
jgi:hypothetical protein